jgi:hypothetical protein
VTFPGIVIHEWAHKKACDSVGARVHDVSYLNVKGLFAADDQPLGYVSHSAPANCAHACRISLSPLLINSSTAILLDFAAANLATSVKLALVLYWLGISIAVHACPSRQDAENVLRLVRTRAQHESYIVRQLYRGVFSFICVLNAFRRWWIDLAWAVVLVILGTRL